MHMNLVECPMDLSKITCGLLVVENVTSLEAWLGVCLRAVLASHCSLA